MEISHDMLKGDPFTDIIGQDSVKLQLKSALLASRHIIIVGSPGIGKTTLARNIARILPDIETAKGCQSNCSPSEPLCPSCKAGKNKGKEKKSGARRFVRIQGSPDLTVEDMLGDIDPVKALQFGPLSVEAFTPGKIFKANKGVLFFDELNRCPEKLQNALLQVLQEKVATISNYDVDMPADFIFIATMNPEDTSTEKLSEVLLDRFDIIYMYFPETIGIEKDIVTANGKKLANVSDELLHLMVHFVRLLRESKDLERKPSVRASIGLYERAQANAVLKGSKQATFRDFQDVVVSVLAHRIRLKPSMKYLKSPEEFIKEEFEKFAREAGREKKGGLP